MNNVLFLKSFFTKKVKGFPPCEDCPPPPGCGAGSPPPSPCEGGCCGGSGGGGGGGGPNPGPFGQAPGSPISFAEEESAALSFNDLDLGLDLATTLKIESDIEDFFQIPPGNCPSCGSAACGGCQNCGGGGLMINNNMGGQVVPVQNSSAQQLQWNILTFCK